MAMDALDELVRLEFPARPAFVGVARAVVAAVAATVDGLDGDRLEDLRVAVSEACTNAVEAHVAGGVERAVVVRCLAGPTELEVRIEDAAGGFDAAILSPRSAGGHEERLAAERGWGLQLIRALVDDAAFASASTGTAVRLRMHLQA